MQAGAAAAPRAKKDDTADAGTNALLDDADDEVRRDAPRVQAAGDVCCAFKIEPAQLHPVICRAVPCPRAGGRACRSRPRRARRHATSSTSAHSSCCSLARLRLEPGATRPPHRASAARERVCIPYSTPSLRRPQQLQFGKPHPDLIVESAALAAVKQPQIYTDYSALAVRCRPDVACLSAWPRSVMQWRPPRCCVQEDVQEGRISDAQLETVAYSMQRFYGERLECGARGGFFLGDGAGVGKGRQIAAIIKAMWERKDYRTRRVLWLSHNKDLREDARRDMVDLHIHVPSSARRPPSQRPRIEVWPQGNKSFPSADRPIREHIKEGVVFGTYDILKAGTGGIKNQCNGFRGQCAHPRQLCLLATRSHGDHLLASVPAHPQNRAVQSALALQGQGGAGTRSDGRSAVEA